MGYAHFAGIFRKSLVHLKKNKHMSKMFTLSITLYARTEYLYRNKDNFFNIFVNPHLMYYIAITAFGLYYLHSYSFQKSEIS